MQMCCALLTPISLAQVKETPEALVGELCISK